MNAIYDPFKLVEWWHVLNLNGELSIHIANPHPDPDVFGLRRSCCCCIHLLGCFLHMYTWFEPTLVTWLNWNLPPIPIQKCAFHVSQYTSASWSNLRTKMYNKCNLV